jgi:hypothetical protein
MRSRDFFYKFRFVAKYLCSMKCLKYVLCKVYKVFFYVTNKHDEMEPIGACFSSFQRLFDVHRVRALNAGGDRPLQELVGVPLFGQDRFYCFSLIISSQKMFENSTDGRNCLCLGSEAKKKDSQETLSEAM